LNGPRLFEPAAAQDRRDAVTLLSTKLEKISDLCRDLLRLYRHVGLIDCDGALA
jgi:hypothetical protein